MNFKHKNGSKHYQETTISNRESTFYDKALYDEFRDNYHWNFPDDKPKIKRK